MDENSPYLEGDPVIVLNEGNLGKVGHTFIGWNTKADGSGENYKPGDSFIINAEVTLYAQWEESSG